MSARRIEVQIERLVLDGFDDAEGHTIAAAIDGALTERLAHAPHARDAIGPVNVGAPSTPARIASAVADCIAGGER